MSSAGIRSVMWRASVSIALLAAYVFLIVSPQRAFGLLDIYFERNGPATGTGAGMLEALLYKILVMCFFVCALFIVPFLWRTESKKELPQRTSFWRRLFYTGMGLSFGYWYRGSCDTALLAVVLLSLAAGFGAMIEGYFANLETV